MLTALIFDFDGVIADTEGLHYEALNIALRTVGLSFSWEEYMSNYISFDDRDIMHRAHRKAGRTLDEVGLRQLVQTKAEAFSSRAANDDLSPLPGVPQLIEACRAVSVPVALCTGSIRSDIDPILARFGLADAFASIVTAEDVAASKPDPESYRKTVDALQDVLAPPGHGASGMLAIEDTPGGVASAKGAGLNVLAVTTTHEPSALAEADQIVSSLADLTLPELSEWVG